MPTTDIAPTHDYIRCYRIRNVERYRAFGCGRFTLWADFEERMAFLRSINKVSAISNLVSTFSKTQAFRLLDFLCEVRLYVEIGNEKGPQAFVDLVRLQLDHAARLERQLSELPPLLSEDDQDRLDSILHNTRQKLEKFRRIAAWYGADPPQNIGTSGRAAASLKGQWLGFVVREQAEHFIPDDIHNRYSIIAELATRCGLVTSRQNVRGILLKGKT